MTQTLLRLFVEREAVKCSNGDSWGAPEARITDKNYVLDVLGSAASE